MSIELAVPKPDRLADDLVAILALSEDQPRPQPSRARRARVAVLLAGLLVAGSAIAIFSVARPPGSGSRADRGIADRDRAPTERGDGMAAKADPAADQRRADAAARAALAAPAAPLPPRLARRDAMPTVTAPPAPAEPNRATIVASRPASSPSIGAAAGSSAAAAVAPRPPVATNLAVARPVAPIVAPPEEVRIAPAEASARREQVASAALPADASPPLAAGDGGVRAKRAEAPLEERKIREGVDALRLLRRQ